MGCGSAKPNEILIPQKKSKQCEYIIVERAADLKISHSDMVGEKQGKINNDYSLLNPPLGKGNAILTIKVLLERFEKLYIKLRSKQGQLK